MTNVSQHDKLTIDAWIGVEHAVQSIGEEENPPGKQPFQMVQLRLLDDSHKLRSKDDIYREIQETN